MTSDELKYAVMQYWRFKRQALYIATEVGAYSPIIKDILVVCKNKVTEIECKISTSDFNGDFAKRKHVFYQYGIHDVPNFLYYAVPDGLKIDESKFEHFPKYGLIRVGRNERAHSHFDAYLLTFSRKAQDIHRKTPKERREYTVRKAQEAIFKRMSSDIVNMRRRLLEHAAEAEGSGNGK